MKTKILIIATALILAFAGSVSAEQWNITRIIVNPHGDYNSYDTATSDLKPYGSLQINNGHVQMVADMCGPSSCMGATYVIKPTGIAYANNNVAVLSTGEEVQIIQLHPELIINVHTMGETNIYFLRQVK